MDDQRRKLADFWPSEQFGIKRGAWEGASVLDVGCSNGALLDGLREAHKKVQYTGIDYGPRILEVASKSQHDAEFIVDEFPSTRLKGRTFDSVFAFATFQFYLDWKGTLKQLASHAKTHIVLDMSLTMDFPTICDADISYVHYLESGNRLPVVVLNVIQFVNYCFTEHVGASNVEIQAVNPKWDTSMHGVPQDKILRGVAVITKDHSKKPFWAPRHKSTSPDFIKDVDTEKFRFPSAKITIDGREIQLYPKKKPL